MEYGLLILYISMAIGVSFLCSILESVLLSISYGHIKILEIEGKKSGQIWSKLKEDDSIRPLTAILTLNTIAHTVGAVGVGSQVQIQIGEQWLTIASALLTLAVLLFSEILPKTLGAVYWKKFAPASGHMILWLTILLLPFVSTIQAFRRLLPNAKSERVTRDELVVLADIGEEEGAIEEDEETVITNLLKLSEISVTDIMTPRVVVTTFPISHSIRMVLDEMPVLRVSRIPVYGEDIDDLKGLVIRSELLTAASRGEWNVTMEEIMNPIEKISDESNVDSALDIFLGTRQQLVAVTDQFGGTCGILTMEDVLETLLGQEIVDETDEVDDMRELALEIAKENGNTTHSLHSEEE